MFSIYFFLILFTSTICEDFYSFTVKDWQGNDVSLEQYRGKVTLVVNVASECSFTDSHYEALVGIQEKLNRGNRNIFQVLAFPSNQFGSQEPNDDMKIQLWAADMFDINFPIFAKGAVIEQGSEVEELPEVWKFLSEKTEPPLWNFWKYLIDPNGNVIKAYSSDINIRQVYPDIQKLLLKHKLLDKPEL
ncbi:unnamed protein product [Rotaria magnacalcarata]|uniref:Glutathione peroxidase n=1 Tax=Rotaria magnacalcarata TaxID=392030 RepID=A0A816GRP9_9BILA|nr:unnamed protein product [Rotaria magnacalcarata]CAF1678890.1 unnamed protein product [Rotaria magnacalcarata]CAF1970631.1 unnamed protein product [Rotaria magnacalcarata]CAF2059002.1 unnamed protein product [Rotaria magnacalcarata]CAF3740893.1 unnamed protein product [Rotaria magnacalcarata]